MLLTACGGQALPEAAADIELRVMDESGAQLAGKAARIESSYGKFEIYALDSEALGFSLRFSPDLHVESVERGDYFTDQDLYLAASELPGRLDIGGYHLGDTAAIPAAGLL